MGKSKPDISIRKLRTQAPFPEFLASLVCLLADQEAVVQGLRRFGKVLNGTEIGCGASIETGSNGQNCKYFIYSISLIEMSPLVF
jgi:hypothetical protein